MANKITVTSAGTIVNANVTSDSAMYYSNKSKEWAISDRIVDNIDYSSKHYANESKKQADISTAKAAEVVESGNTAVSNIESARDNAIADIVNQENVSVDNVNTAGTTQIALATEQANIATQQATIATNKAGEVVESGNTALSNIDTAKNNAITSITNQETTSKNNVIATGNEQVARIEATGNNYDNLTHKNITNCILSAPNGVTTYSGSSITLKQGLKMLYPNGRNIDKTLKNGELTLDSDTIIDLSSYSGQTFDFELMFGCNINDSYPSQNYQESDVAPSNFSGLNQIYLNTTENQMYFYDSSSSSWKKRTFIKLGKGKLVNGVVTSFTPYQPVELLKRSDKAEITSWAFPSSKFDELTLGASGQKYTAPTDGFFVFDGSFTGYNHLEIFVEDGQRWTMNIIGQGNWHLAHTWGVRKGVKTTINYPAPFTSYIFKFIYAEGAK